jgi:hypothetical protein
MSRPSVSSKVRITDMSTNNGEHLVLISSSSLNDSTDNNNNNKKKSSSSSSFTSFTVVVLLIFFFSLITAAALYTTTTPKSTSRSRSMFKSNNDKGQRSLLKSKETQTQTTASLLDWLFVPKSFLLRTQTKHQKQKNEKTDNIEIFVIAQPGDERDKEGFERIRNSFPAAQTTIGITAAKWPEQIKEAEWAIEPIRKLNEELFDTNKYHYSEKFVKENERTAHSLKNLRWIGVIDERNEKSGKLPKDKVGLAHHIGCLFAHLHAWRSVTEQLGKQRAWIMESDGNEVPDRTLEMKQLLRNVPDDFDFISLGPHYDEVCIRTEHTVGFFPSNNCEKSRFEFKVEKDPNDKYSRSGKKTFYYWPKMGNGAGLQSYLIGPNFYDKVMRYLARHGADMIDAFMFGHLCQNNYVNEEAKVGGIEPPKGFEDITTKRLTSRDESGLKILNCYVVGPVEDCADCLFKHEEEEGEEEVDKNKSDYDDDKKEGSLGEDVLVSERRPFAFQNNHEKEMAGDSTNFVGSDESFEDLLSKFETKHGAAKKPKLSTTTKNAKSMIK